MAANSIAGALDAISLFLGAGLGLTLCLPGIPRMSLAGRLAFAYLLGVAWIGLFLYLASHFGGVTIDGPLVFIAAFVPLAAGAAVAVAMLVRKRWRAPAARRPRRLLQTLGWLACALLTAVFTAAVLGNALTRPLTDWDGRMTWAAQAVFIREAGTVDAEVLRSAESFINHPRYPLLMPLAQNAALAAAGREDECIFRAMYAAFYPALVLLVAEATRRWAGARAALVTTLALLTIPWIPFDSEGGATGAYSDLPLACFFGAALALLVRGRPRASAGLAAGLLLAAAMLTKNEGLPAAAAALVLAGGGAVLALRRRRRSARARLLATAAALGVVMVALALLLDWRASIPSRYDEAYFETASLPALVSDLASARAFSILPVIAGRMFDTGLWGLFWWLAPVVFLVALPRLRRPPLAVLALAAATPLMVAWAAYSHHAQGPTADFYAEVTWNRMLLQAAVPLFGLLALAVRRLLAGFPSTLPPAPPSPAPPRP
jgi:hypothetical protein